MPATPIGTASFTLPTAWPALTPLLSDGDDVVSRQGTVASGIGILKRGTIVNIVPATGVITVPSTTAGCNAILVDDIDATSATVAAAVYLSGKVKADALTWPGALAHADCADALRNYGIYVESVEDATGLTVKSVPTAEEQKEAVQNLDKARAAAKEKKEVEEERADNPPPMDSPWAYMTPEEKETSPNLPLEAAQIARQEFDEKQGHTAKHAARRPPEAEIHPSAPPPHRPGEPPPHKPEEPKKK